MARAPRAETLILDIETIPDAQRWQRPEAPQPAAPPPVHGAPPPPPSPPPPARGDVFPPIWAHRIVVIGCLLLDHGYRLKRLGVIESATDGTPDEQERALLEAFSRFMTKERPVLVTYNGRSFDLPVIAMRSLCHAVSLPWYYRDRDVRSRYSGAGHLDLCDWLAEHGAIRAGKLDQVARLIGLPGKTGIDGSQVEGLHARGELAAIQQYCLADVAQTALLFLRFRLLQGAIEPVAYRERIGELVDALAADGRVTGVLEGLDRERLLGPPLMPGEDPADTAPPSA